MTCDSFVPCDFGYPCDVAEPIDIMQALIWQYNEATNLQNILEGQQSWLDENHTKFWTDFYTYVFDLRTANDFGLSLWAIILGVSFRVETEEDPDKRIFGYAPYGANYYQSNYSAKSSAGITLTTDQKRAILQLRYLKMTRRPTVPNVNYALRQIAPSAYVLDIGDMTYITVGLSGAPTSREKYILENFDIIPGPSGVEERKVYNLAYAKGYDPTGMNYYSAVYGKTV